MYLQIFLSFEQAQKVQESLSWTHPAQNIRQNTKAELRESCSPGALGTAQLRPLHRAPRQGKEEQNNPKFLLEGMDRLNSQRDKCPESELPQQEPSWGSSEGASEAFSNLPDAVALGMGALQCWDSRTFRLM